jgi:hypothetical protein
MEKCTQNILNSIEKGSTTIENWEQYCKRFERKSVYDIDEYQYETWKGAREALSIITQQEQQES